MTRFALAATTALVTCYVFGDLRPALAAEAALIGKVTSAEEGAMEGVVVSARQDGSTIRVSVITDAQGQFAFPATRIEPGNYTISIRAAGYDLDGSDAASIAAQKTTLDLKLKRTQN